MRKLPRMAHKGWEDCDAFDELPKISKNLMTGSYYPEPSIWAFRAFEMNPLDIRVIVMGMSPYPNTNFYTKQPNACGYAFAIEDGSMQYRQWPASLRVIYQSILDFEQGILDPTLSTWRDQGVFLLNAGLTCLKEDPESHMSLWKPFTAKLVKYISGLPGQRIWYFLGDEAKHFARYVEPFQDICTQSIHPARAARTGELFDGQFRLVRDNYKKLFNEELRYLQNYRP